MTRRLAVERGRWNGALAALGVLVAVALALITPTNGLCYPKMHELIPLHPLIYHEHDPHAAHRAPRSEGPVAAAPSAWSTTPIVAPAGPFGPEPSMAIGGMIPSLVQSLVSGPALSASAADRALIPQTIWIEVPTGPPRRTMLLA